MTEINNLAYDLVDSIYALRALYALGHPRDHAGEPNLYLGREEYRCLRLADDYFFRSRWNLQNTRQNEFMDMPVFVVDAKNHLNVG